jgi:uncharacterized protein YmfQ (DUF2313 family)
MTTLPEKHLTYKEMKDMLNNPYQNNIPIPQNSILGATYQTKKKENKTMTNELNTQQQEAIELAHKMGYEIKIDSSTETFTIQEKGTISAVYNRLRWLRPEWVADIIKTREYKKGLDYATPAIKSKIIKLIEDNIL